MGYHESALKAIRLSLGRDTTTADVDWAMVLKQVLQRLTSVQLVVSRWVLLVCRDKP